MADYFYHAPLGNTDQSGYPTYVLGVPRRPKNSSRRILGILAITGLALSAIGLLTSLVSPAAWASGILVVGLMVFCIAGYLGRQSDHRRSATWRLIS